jgi:hypothetical protein
MRNLVVGLSSIHVIWINRSPRFRGTGSERSDFPPSPAPTAQSNLFRSPLSLDQSLRSLLCIRTLVAIELSLPTHFPPSRDARSSVFGSVRSSRSPSGHTWTIQIKCGLLNRSWDCRTHPPSDHRIALPDNVAPPSVSGTTKFAGNSKGDDAKQGKTLQSCKASVPRSTRTTQRTTTTLRAQPEHEGVPETL